MNATAIYLIRFWIKPGSEDKVLGWLDGGHIADVVKQPGFRWAQRIALELPDADSWPRSRPPGSSGTDETTP